MQELKNDTSFQLKDISTQSNYCINNNNNSIKNDASFNYYDNAKMLLIELKNNHPDLSESSYSLGLADPHYSETYDKCKYLLNDAIDKLDNKLMCLFIEYKFDLFKLFYPNSEYLILKKAHLFAKYIGEKIIDSFYVFICNNEIRNNNYLFDTCMQIINSYIIDEKLHLLEGITVTYYSILNNNNTPYHGINQSAQSHVLPSYGFTKIFNIFCEEIYQLLMKTKNNNKINAFNIILSTYLYHFNIDFVLTKKHEIKMQHKNKTSINMEINSNNYALLLYSAYVDDYDIFFSIINDTIDTRSNCPVIETSAIQCDTLSINTTINEENNTRKNYTVLIGVTYNEILNRCIELTNNNSILECIAKIYKIRSECSNYSNYPMSSISSISSISSTKSANTINSTNTTNTTNTNFINTYDNSYAGNTYGKNNTYKIFYECIISENVNLLNALIKDNLIFELSQEEINSLYYTCTKKEMIDTLFLHVHKNNYTDLETDIESNKTNHTINTTNTTKMTSFSNIQSIDDFIDIGDAVQEQNKDMYTRYNDKYSINKPMSINNGLSIPSIENISSSPMLPSINEKDENNDGNIFDIVQKGNYNKYVDAINKGKLKKLNQNDLIILLKLIAYDYESKMLIVTLDYLKVNNMINEDILKTIRVMNDHIYDDFIKIKTTMDILGSWIN